MPSLVGSEMCIRDRSKDASGLTQSGQMKPVVDFEHISEVLVIKQLKEELKD